MRRLLGALVVVLAFTTACDGGRDPTPTDAPGTAEPSTAGGSILEGSTARLRSTLASMRGRPVVVNYWATWCEPCKVEMPRLVDAFKEHSDRVGFLGVNVEDDIEAAESFIRRYEIPFRSVADPSGEVRRDQKILGLPVTQFYGADGELALVHQGEIKTDDLEEKIEEVLRLSR